MINLISKKKLQILHKNIKNYGYFHLKNGIKKKYLDKLLSRVKKFYNPYIKDKNLPSRDVKDLKVFNLVLKDKIFIDLISNTEIEKILKPLLNDPYYRVLDASQPNYILKSFNARSSGYKLDLHIDSGFPYKGKYLISVLILFVLEDMNKENGATVVVPKSHKSGNFSNRKTKNTKLINANAGDILIIDARVWHGTTENKTNNSRWLINALFSQWWLKQQTLFTESLPKKIYKKLSRKQKSILGYCSIPPRDENERIMTKSGYSILK